MGSNSKTAHGALGKSDVLQFDPEDVVLVVDEASPLYDKRVHLPVSEGMVLNLMAYGQVQPGAVWKNPESGKTEVVVGRQRVKALREANKRLAAEGRPTLRFAATIRRGQSAGQMAAVVAIENAIRRDDTPLERADKMARMQNFGVGDDELAIVFGVSVNTVRNTLALLDCSASVKTAVEKGQIKVTDAQRLSKMEVSEQREKVAELIHASASTTGHAKAKAQRAVMKSATAAQVRGVKEIRAKLEELPARGAAHNALLWVLGEDWE